MAPEWTRDVNMEIREDGVLRENALVEFVGLPLRRLDSRRRLQVRGVNNLAEPVLG
jgi:hypothetical protein